MAPSGIFKTLGYRLSSLPVPLADSQLIIVVVVGRRDRVSIIGGNMREYSTIIGISIATILIVGIAIVLPVRTVSHYYDAKYCPVKLKELGRQGKFVDYNYWDWNCLVKTDNGTYVTIDRLLNVSEDK
jgi:hypothetical protein